MEKDCPGCRSRCHPFLCCSMTFSMPPGVRSYCSIFVTKHYQERPPSLPLTFPVPDNGKNCPVAPPIPIFSPTPDPRPPSSTLPPAAQLYFMPRIPMQHHRHSLSYLAPPNGSYSAAYHFTSTPQRSNNTQSIYVVDCCLSYASFNTLRSYPSPIRTRLQSSGR